jgi:hypothetical protein
MSRRQRHLQGLVKGAQINPAERRMIIHPRDGRIIRAEQARLGGTVAASAQREVQIPEDHLPAVSGRFIGPGVLAPVVTVPVPVGDNPARGEHPHPLFDVDHRLHRGRVGVGAGRVERVDQGEQTRVIVVQPAIGPFVPVPTVTGLFLGTAGGGEVLEGGVHVELALHGIVELEPVIDLEQFAPRSSSGHQERT